MFWEIVLFLIIFKLLVVSTNAKCNSKVCLVGKTAVVTGGNSGLGRETARTLASRGCKVIIADKDDATYTVKALISETHNYNITSIEVDFASFKSVRNFAKVINSTEDRLDILVNNAGIGDVRDLKTEDGLQKIMQVNYFSHFLLVHLLAGLLRKTAPSRILYTSSIAAYLFHNLNVQNLQKGVKMEKSPICSTGPYGNSKLAGAIASKLFAQKFKGNRVTSNCYHPGLVKTRIFSNSWKAVDDVKSYILEFFMLIFSFFFGKSPEEGAQTMLYLAMSDDVINTSGKFFFELFAFPQPRPIYDEEFCRKIWEESERIVGLNPEEKLDYILNNNNKK